MLWDRSRHADMVRQGVNDLSRHLPVKAQLMATRVKVSGQDLYTSGGVVAISAALLLLKPHGNVSASFVIKSLFKIKIHYYLNNSFRSLLGSLVEYDHLYFPGCFLGRGDKL